MSRGGVVGGGGILRVIGEKGLGGSSVKKIFITGGDRFGGRSYITNATLPLYEYSE